MASKREKIHLFESGEKILRKFHLKNQAMTSGSQFPLLGRAPRVEAGLLSRYTTRKPPLSFLPSITSMSYAMQWCHNKTWNSRFSLVFSLPNSLHKKAQETNCMHNYGTSIPTVVVNLFFFSKMYFLKLLAMRLK